MTFVLLWIPGELLRRRYFPHGPLEIRYPLALLGGMSLWALVTWGCWLLGVSFAGYVAALEALCTLFFALSIFRHARSRRAEPITGHGAAAHEAGGRGRLQGLVLAACALFIAVFFSFFPPQISHQSDALVHIGLYRSMVSENTLAPQDAVALPVSAGGETTKPDPRVGAAHPLFAAVAWLSGADPMDLWRWIPVAAAPAAFLAFTGFAAALLPGPGHLVFAVLLFVMFQGGMGREFFGAIGYGQNLSLVFMWLFVVLALRYVREQSRGILFLVALLSAGGALVHVDTVVHVALACAAFIIFYRVFGFTPTGLAALCVVALAGAGAGAAWRAVTTYQGANALHSHPEGLLYFMDVGDRFFVLSPAEIVRKNGLLFLAALFLIPLLAFQGRHRRFALMSFALSVPPVVTALNPLVCPALYAKLHYLVHRFALNIPAILVTAVVLGAAVSWGRSRSLWRKAAAGVFLFLWGWVFLVAARAWVSDIRAIGRTGRDRVVSAELGEAVRFINERIPAGSVVASDAVTSYALSALTDVRVVAVLGQHGNPNDRYPIERLSAVYTIMSPYTSQIESLAAVRRFGVDYILVNGALAGPYHEFFAEWDPEFFSILEEKYGTLHDVFQRVYRSERVLIYRVQRASLEKVTWEPDIPYLALLSGDVRACAANPEGAEVGVEGMSVAPRTALPGETVRLTLSYWRAPGAGLAWPLVLRLRIEDKSYFAQIRRYPGDKYVRRFRERREGSFHRFRIDRKPFDGYYPAHRWPDVGLCYENVEVRLPNGLDESVYEVQWQLVEETLLPNFSLHDFVYNDDSYAGVPCAEFEVRRQVIR